MTKDITAQEKAFRDRVTVCRARMLADQPFFALLSWHFKNVVDMDIPTAQTDCLTFIKFNLDFMDKLSDPDFMFVYCHEILHGAMRHNSRRFGRKKALWNVACDFAINPVLVQNGLKMPQVGGLYNKAWAGKSVEEIYDILEKMTEEQQKQETRGSGFGDGQGHITDDPPQGTSKEEGKGKTEKTDDGEGSAQEMTPEEVKAMEDKLAQTVRHAALAAHARGKLPGGIEGMVDMLEKPVVNWKPELWDFFNSICPSGFSWKRPNRRHTARRMYLPSPTRREAIDTFVIAVDSSGSVWDVQTEFCTEAFYAAQAANPKRIIIIWCDAGVQKVEEMTDISEWRPAPKGCGGTSFRPVFDYIEENDIRPAGLVFLTDLDGEMPESAPDYPVLWAVGGSWWRGAIAPFGRTVEIKPKRQ